MGAQIALFTIVRVSNATNFPSMYIIRPDSVKDMVHIKFESTELYSVDVALITKKRGNRKEHTQQL